MGISRFITRLSAALAGAAMLCTQIPAIDAFAADEAGFESNGIPIVYINIDESKGTIEQMNSSEDHSAECKGKITIDVPDGYKGDYSAKELEDINDLKLDYIKGRGNSTWEADKKPYKLKLDKSTDLLGMGKNKHWALLANRFDQSLMRNRVGMYIAERLGLEYTPKMLPVDVVMNGEYLGSYVLAQSVRVGKTRVEIDELSAEDNAEPEITGGYLLSLLGDHDDDPEDTRITTENGIGFIAEEPSFDFSENAKESGTKEQKAYIADYLQKTENAILSENFCDENGVPYTDYMDIKSAADYWWLQVLSDNYDAYRTSSTYLYKGRNDKLCWGPVWDFDMSFGNGSSGGLEFNIGSENRWLDYLRAYDPEYLKMLKERWEALDEIIDEVAKDGGVIDTYADEIKDSWKDDADKWGEWIASRKPLTNLETEVSDLKTYFIDRRKWVNEHIDLINNVYYYVLFKTDKDGGVVQSERIRVGAGLDELPQAPEKEGYTFAGWENESGEIVETVYATEDTVLVAKYTENAVEDVTPEEPEEKPEDEDKSNEPEADNEPENAPESGKENKETPKADDKAAVPVTSNPKTGAAAAMSAIALSAAAAVVMARKRK